MGSSPALFTSARVPSFQGRRSDLSRVALQIIRIGLNPDAGNAVQPDPAAMLNLALRRVERRLIDELSSIQCDRAINAETAGKLARRHFGEQPVGQAADQHR